MSATPSFKLAPCAAHAKCGLIEQALAALVDGREPSLVAVAADADLREIVARMSFFVRAETGGRVLTGAEALRHQYGGRAPQDQRGCRSDGGHVDVRERLSSLANGKAWGKRALRGRAGESTRRAGACTSPLSAPAGPEALTP